MPVVPDPGPASPAPARGSKIAQLIFPQADQVECCACRGYFDEFDLMACSRCFGVYCLDCNNEHDCEEFE